MKFLSSKREVFSPEKYNPAPGEYDINRQIISKKDFSLETGKAGAKANDSSTTHKNINSNPGPGAYHKKKAFGQDNSTKHNNMFQKVQQKFNNDMPQGTMSRPKREQGDLGSLVQNQKSSQIQLEVQRELNEREITLGPGHYNPIYSVTKPKTNGANIYKSRRQNTVNDIQELPQDHQFIIGRPQTVFITPHNNKHLKNNQYKIIKSNTNNYKRNKIVDFKRQQDEKELKAQTKIQIDLLKENNKKEILQKFFNLGNNKIDFGVKEKRFKQKDSIVPGPGSYSVEKYYENEDRKVQGVLGKESRFREEGQEMQPGPGWYNEIVEVNNNHHTNPRDFPSAFGSGTLKQSPYSNQYLNTPGPGQYDHSTQFNLSKKTKQLKVFTMAPLPNPSLNKNININIQSPLNSFTGILDQNYNRKGVLPTQNRVKEQQNAIFKSKMERFITQENENELGPGEYEVQVEKVSHNVRKNIDVGTERRRLKQPKGETNQRVGPGSYDSQFKAIRKNNCRNIVI